MPHSRCAVPPAGADVQMLRILNERMQTFRAVLVPTGGRYELRDQQTGQVIAANIDLATFAKTNPHLMQPRRLGDASRQDDALGDGVTRRQR